MTTPFYVRDSPSMKRHGNRRHGLTDSAEHKTWVGMRRRCRDTLNKGRHKNYASKGIAVCERWDTFENFLSDMGARPSADHSLGRINNHLGYCPENCRWESREQQQNNRCCNRILTFNGLSQTVTQWARQIGVPYDTLFARIYNGWSTSKALTTKLQKHIK